MSDGAVSEAVAKVEKELAKFWSAPDTSTGGEVPKVRASTMNYVVLCAAADLEAHRAASLALAEVRAGRVFLLTLDGRLAPWEMTSNVAMTCMRAGDEQICHDRVELAFGAAAAARAASVVTTLALPEVPTIVELARGAPTALVDALVRGADRVIVDSSHTSLARVAEITRKTAAPIADRAMVRAFTFRDLIARFFDADPRAARVVRSVAFTRTAGGDAPEALLLGWLGSRLGWSWASRSLATDASGREVSVQVVEQARVGVGPGELVGVEIHADAPAKELVGAFTRGADARVVDWTLRGERDLDIRHALGFRDETWVLLKALDASKADAVTRDALVSAAAWLHGPEAKEAAR